VIRDGVVNMKQAVDMLTKLVDDLLDTAKTRSGKMDVAPKQVELCPIVEESVQAFRLAWEAKRLDLRQKLDAGLTVMGDPVRLQQIVWNIISNAIKHTPPKGSIEVALRRDDGHGVLEVRDSGSGIDPAFLPHIFEPFRQQTGGGGGLGLGLAIARSLVESGAAPRFACAFR
jgi:two-component system CheB/CheR fusion protein